MTLNFKYEIEINRPLDQVVRLFTDRDQLPKWQRGLYSDEELPTVEGHKKYQLTYDLGKRKLKMTETIVQDQLPGLYIQLYEMKGVRHTVNNTFTAIGAHKTKWNSEVQFQFSGFKRLIASYLKSDFEKQSWMIMRSFKAFAERTEV